MKPKSISIFAPAFLAIFGAVNCLQGQTWQVLPAAYSNYTSADKKVFASELNNTIVVGYDKNANPSESSLSIDGGDNWQPIFADKPIQAGLFAPDGNIYLATLLKVSGMPIYNKDSLFRSSDGVNWTCPSPYPSNMATGSDEGDFFVTKNNTLLFPASTNGVVHLNKSVDQGQSWTATSSINVTQGGVEAIVASPSADTIFVGTYNSGPRYSHDGGATFSSMQSSSGTTGANVMLPNGHIYVSGTSFSTDGGVTFSTITWNPWVAMSVLELFYHEASGKFFTRAVQGIFESTDCITWTNISGNVTDPHTITDMAVSENYLFVCKYNDDNLYRLEITGSAGVKDQPNQKAIALYPNPAATSLNFSNVEPGTTLEVIDLAGAVVLEFVSNQTAGSMSVAHLPEGVYIVRATSKGQTGYQKLMIKRS